MSLMKNYITSGNDTRVIYLSVFTAVAAALSLVEKLIPMPVPWVKPGLANIVTLILIYCGKYRDALVVAILRTFLVAALSAGIFSIGHFFSLSGVIASFTIMVLLHRFTKDVFSIYGISITGAYFHSLGQLVCGAVFFISGQAVIAIAPFFLLLSIISGFITARLAKPVLHEMELLV